MAIIQIQPYDYFYQWRDKTNQIATLLGDIELINISAPDNTSLISSINKVISNIGGLVGLPTTDKSSIVASITEIDSNIGDIVSDISDQNTLIGNGALTTTATDLTEAINELDTEHGTLSSLQTSYKANFVGSINELFDKIGPLASLNTTEKDSLVGAVSEVQTELGDVATLSTTEKTNTVGAINELYDMFKLGTPVITVTAEDNDVINVTVQFKDLEGSNITFPVSVFMYLSDNSDGTSLIATAHSVGWSIGTNGVLIDNIANKSARCITNITGAIDIDIEEVGSKTSYLVLVMPMGNLVISDAITHA
jgi:hypothetical protein